MANEHFNYTNATGSVEWKQVADASHDIVNIYYYGAEDFEVALKEGAEPVGTSEHMHIGGSGTAAGSGAFVCVENANTDVWVRIQPGHAVNVVRGSAKITIFGSF